MPTLKPPFPFPVAGHLIEIYQVGAGSLSTPDGSSPNAEGHLEEKTESKKTRLCKCGVSFSWVKVNRKWHALNANGLSHWVECRLRGKKKRKPAGGLLEIRGKRIVGEHYRQTCAGCAVPPWELCACSFSRESNESNESI